MVLGTACQRGLTNQRNLRNREMIFISICNSPVENIHNLRSVFETIAHRRGGLFQSRTLVHANCTINNHITSHVMRHLINAGLISIHSRKGKKKCRRLVYQRHFDSDIDIDKWMEVMIKNDLRTESRYKVPHLR